MRSASWFLVLALLLSLPASAQEGQGGGVYRKRTLLVPPQPDAAPLFELHLAAGIATLVDFDVPLDPGPPQESLDEHGRIRLLRLDEDSLILVASADLAEGEHGVLTVGSSQAGPLRLLLVTRRDEVDQHVRVVRTRPPADDEDASRVMALHLLGTARASPALTVPQQEMKLASKGACAYVPSVLQLGPRLFVTLAIRSLQEGSVPWRPRQMRLRALPSPGSTSVEWPAPFFSGPVEERLVRQQLHVFTALLPEGTTRLEVALDDEASLGSFHALPLGKARVLP